VVPQGSTLMSGQLQASSPFSVGLSAIHSTLNVLPRVCTYCEVLLVYIVFGGWSKGITLNPSSLVSPSRVLEGMVWCSVEAQV
jgi:hypothetical protein